MRTQGDKVEPLPDLREHIVVNKKHKFLQQVHSVAKA
jgi:hypothetical protein